MIKNYTTKTDANGVVSLVDAGQERSILQTAGDLIIAPFADSMAKDEELVQRKTRGWTGLAQLGIGFFSGEYFGHRRAAKGKGPLLPFLKV